MPEFSLDLGGNAAQFDALDSFTQGYIEAMFFTEEERLCEDSDSDWTMPDVAINRDTMESRFVGGDTPSFSDLAPETLVRIVAECQAFQHANESLLESAYGIIEKYAREPYEESRAGNDYWYSRNGHGTGFWDRGLGDIGDRLHKACQYQDRDLYRGDDGRLYF